ASSIRSDFNGTGIRKGNVIWFTSVLKVSGVGADPVTIFLNDSTIRFSANGHTFTLDVPDAVVTLSAPPKAEGKGRKDKIENATTVFDTGTNRWVTVVSADHGNAFLAGLAVPVPTDLPDGIKPGEWSGRFPSDGSGVKVQWQWEAAVYSQLSSDFNALGVKPVGGKVGTYHDSDHAGTPENFKTFVTGGARGGGGSNFTGG